VVRPASRRAKSATRKGANRVADRARQKLIEFAKALARVAAERDYAKPKKLGSVKNVGSMRVPAKKLGKNA
jgi:hypothetical protein